MFRLKMKSKRRGGLTACLLTLAAGGSLLAGQMSGAQATAPTAKPTELSGLSAPAAVRWKDLDGRAHDFGEAAQHKATVFFFASTQCPVSNIYTPRINELAAAYGARGVQFFLVNSNHDDTLATVRRDAKARRFTFPVVKDQGTALADALAADKTPEAVILDARGLVRYRGRLDDNQERTRIIRSDVRDALEDLLASRAVARPRTLAFGCSIFRDTARPVALAPGTVTYARDVAKILNAKCVACHRPGEAAPFALTNYAEARTWAASIKEYTARHLMPPWKAVPGYGDFHDARALSEKEIATLAKWADAGAVPGDLKQAPPAPRLAVHQEWNMGQPDAVVRPVRAYHLAAEGADVYREYVLPMDFAEDHYLRGMELKAGNRAIVHHMVMYFDRSGKSAQMDGKETEPGYSVAGTNIGIPYEDEVFVKGWAPGNTANFLPTGTAFKIGKGWKMVLQVHYHKDGKVEEDNSAVGLYFADKASVEKEMYTFGMINAFFRLNPGDAHKEVKANLTVPADVTLWAVMPHMHLLGREMKLTATLPDGSTRPLIYVADWDFNWQETYRYKQPVHLPKGSKIELTAIYDNSERNPRQPTHPPRIVGWGEQTTDEMCLGLMQITVDAQHLNAAQKSASTKP